LRKLAVVFNTCGIARRPDIRNYISSIDSILQQDLDDCEVVLSSCCNHTEDIGIIKDVFENKISYSQVNDVVPVSVTFNLAVDKAVERFGEFEGYVFIDSGIDFENNTYVLSELYDLFKSGPYGMVAARTDDDMGFKEWYQTDMVGDSLFNNNQHLVINVGQAINLHVQLFSNQLRKYYRRCLPDIFAGQCMESVFSFLCAALKTKWVVHKDLIVNHKTNMDGASSGFSPHKWMASGNPTWDHMFRTDESILQIIGRGLQFGMGYEELRKIAMHNPAKFNADGFAVDDGLKDYIRDNMFLTNEQFSYADVVQEFD